jgi:UDP-2-acetamido-2,6-beta-L-arabino-hexul-4-ose reductase
MIKNALVTGAAGFIGKNLILALSRSPEVEAIGIDIDSPAIELDRALDTCEIVFHLAGANRPEQEAEFEIGNVGSLVQVLEGLERHGRGPLIVLSSSAQAVLDNPYGRSKKRAEDALLEHAKRTATPARIFRLPGIFGKWCRPNYNSVVATFCYNIARGLPILIDDPDREIEIAHVDDVVANFVELISKEHEGAIFSAVAPIFRISLGKLAEKLHEFKMTTDTLHIADLSDPFLKKLYGTYVSYLPADKFAHNLAQKADSRGVLAEILKAGGYGQIFVSRTKPGITRGNHYHDTKVEKFLVLEGDAIIKFRNLATGEKAEYSVNGRELKFVDIPPGWTHSIQNKGASEIIVLFWASEVFETERPDTYPAEV